MTVVLGLTGSIATGKSTVAAVFRQENIPVIDADELVRELQAKNQVGWRAIVQEFGEEILDEAGELNRGIFRALVFSDEVQMKRLEKAFDPLIRSRVKEEISRKSGTGIPLVVVDIPLLFEKGYEELVDQIMVVFVPYELEVRRLMVRESLSEDKAKLLISLQGAIGEKKRLADIVIDNSESVLKTKLQVELWLRSFFHSSAGNH